LEKEMSDNKSLIIPTTYHEEARPIATVLLRRIKFPGTQDALDYALSLTKVKYLSDFPHDQQCRDVEAVNRKNLYDLLKAVKGENALPGTFMQDLAKTFLEAAEEASQEGQAEQVTAQRLTTTEYVPII
jgi:hypothetical protein